MPVLEKNLTFVRIQAKGGKMLYPIGIQDFEKIRKDGFVYVDKTDLIFKIGVRFSTENRCIDSWKLAE